MLNENGSAPVAPETEPNNHIITSPYSPCTGETLAPSLDDRQEAINDPRLSAALRYAEQGVYVFPVRVSIVDGRKKISPIDAWTDVSTCDPATILGWFDVGGSWFGASVAIDCGRSGIVVVDLDEGADKAGVSQWAAIRANGGVAATWRAITPSGGEHWYYRARKNHPVGNSAGRVAPDIDIRGDGGLVLAPPSLDDRGSYRWVEGEPEWQNLPEVPMVVVERLQARPTPVARMPAPKDTRTGSSVRDRTCTPEYAEREITRWLDMVRIATEGSRNDTLNRSAFRVGCFVPTFVDVNTAATGLMRAALDCGLEYQEISQTLDSGLNAGMAEPYTLWTPPVVSADEPETKIRVDVTNAATSSDWLRLEAGTGPLSGVFLRDGQLVRTPSIDGTGYVIPGSGDTDADSARIEILTDTKLRSVVQYAYSCYKVVARKDSDGEKTFEEIDGVFPLIAATAAVSVPDMLANTRKLRGVTHTPIVRVDGSILEDPGYDTDTGFLYLPAPGFSVSPVAQNPTDSQVKEAVGLLEHMVSGFNFVTNSDRANYFGLLLTPLLRELVPPPYKLGAIGAPSPGSGKTLLANILRLIHGGTFRAEIPEGEELRKAVTTLLGMTTGPVVHFDNVTGILRSSTLAGLLTSPVWSDRKLGATENMDLSNDRLWVVTGNNLSLGGDLLRRTVWITIDPAIPSPELRTGFAIPQLERWVTEHRGQIIGALLLLIRHWVHAGMPTESRGADTYGPWIEAVGGILAHAGVAGTFNAPEAVRQFEGTDDEEWGVLYHHVQRVFGAQEWTTKDFLRRVLVFPIGGDPDDIPLDVLPDKLADRVRRSGDPLSVARSLGTYLKNREGRWTGGYAVRKTGEDRDKAVLWRLVVTE